MNLIFDFDGVICNSLDEAVKTVNEFLVNQKLPTTSLREIRRVGVLTLIERYKIPKIKIPKLLIMGRKAISKKIPYLKPFPNILKMLAKLSEKHQLFIITSNSKQNVYKFLKRYKSEKIFLKIDDSKNLFGKEGKIKRIIGFYKLNKFLSYYIGDETRDVLAAKRAGIKSVAVSWGYESKSVLRKANPDLLISRVEELLKL
jgi:phosphoglycolate phosphatase